MMMRLPNQSLHPLSGHVPPFDWSMIGRHRHRRVAYCFRKCRLDQRAGYRDRRSLTGEALYTLSSLTYFNDKDKQRLPAFAVGSAWAMQKGTVTIKPQVDADTPAMNIKPGK